MLFSVCHRGPSCSVCTTALLLQKSSTSAIIKHGWVYIGKQSNGSINPGQIPVTTFDKAQFALAKVVQGKWARCL